MRNEARQRVGVVSRIRTVKPEFVRHSGLYDAELETGLPVRVSFIGLWTACDREGRFKWNPRELKIECLPHDQIDFSRVLDALLTRGHIEQYLVDGRLYGFIPSWHRHQVINNRESKSILPEPTENSIATARCTREARVSDASATPLVHAQGEGKGREKEWKGREGDSTTAAQSLGRDYQPKPEAPTNATWTAYATAYERRYGIAPVRNRTVNGQLANFVERIPRDEAPSVAQFYVEHDNQLYRNAQHPVNLMLRDAESLRTQCMTGTRAGGAGPPTARNSADKAARVAAMLGMNGSKDTIDA